MASDDSPTFRQKLRSANILLCVDKNYEAAAAGFTDLLLNITPGHSHILFNRALCHLAMDSPHLAVVDAHRAVLSSVVAGDRKDFTKHASYILHYKNFSQSALLVQEDWSEQPHRWLMDGAVEFLNNQLGQVNMTFRTMTSTDKAREHTLFEMTIKANYLLAYSLWACGGGAFSDAKEIVDVTLKNPFVIHAYKTLFKRLKSGMLWNIDSAVLSKVDTGLVPAPNVAQTKAEVAAVLKSRWTGYPRRTTENVNREMFISTTGQQFPEFEDESEKAKSLEMLAQQLKIFGDRLKVRTKATPDSRRTIARAIVAKEDIPCDAVLWTEEAPVQVVTAETDSNKNLVFCDGCSAKLIIPRKVLKRISCWIGELQSQSPSPLANPGNSEATSAPVVASSPPASSPPVDPSDPTTSSDRETISENSVASDIEVVGDLNAFVDSRLHVWCSSSCRGYAETQITEWVRKCPGGTGSKLELAAGVPHPRTQLLESLLFGDLIAREPYERLWRWIKLSEATLRWDNASTAALPEYIPWSYHSNVLCPLAYATGSLQPSHTALFPNTLDGWQINALRDFVARNRRITKHIRRYISYNEDGYIVPDGRVEISNEDDVWSATFENTLGQFSRSGSDRVANTKARTLGLEVEISTTQPETRPLSQLECPDEDGWYDFGHVDVGAISETSPPSPPRAATIVPSGSPAIRRNHRVLLPAKVCDETVVDMDGHSRFRAKYPELYRRPQGQPRQAMNPNATRRHWRAAKSLIEARPGQLDEEEIEERVEYLHREAGLSKEWIRLMARCDNNTVASGLPRSRKPLKPG